MSVEIVHLLCRRRGVMEGCSRSPGVVGSVYKIVCNFSKFSCQVSEQFLTHISAFVQHHSVKVVTEMKWVVDCHVCGKTNIVFFICVLVT